MSYHCRQRLFRSSVRNRQNHLATAMGHREFNDDGRCAGSEVSSLQSGTARAKGQYDHTRDSSTLPFVPPFEILIRTYHQELTGPQQREADVVEWLMLPAISESKTTASINSNDRCKDVFFRIPHTRRIVNGSMLVDDGDDVVGPTSLPTTIRRRSRNLSTDSPSILMKNDDILEVPSTPSTYHTGSTRWMADDGGIQQYDEYDNIRRTLVFEEKANEVQIKSKWTKRNNGRFSWLSRRHRQKSVEPSPGCII